MPQSHHRREHKSHIRNYHKEHQSGKSGSKTSKSSGSSVLFLIIGAIAGLGLSFFASEGSPYWVLIGTNAGALVGYFVEKKAF